MQVVYLLRLPAALVVLFEAEGDLQANLWLYAGRELADMYKNVFVMFAGNESVALVTVPVFDVALMAAHESWCPSAV